MAYIVFFWSKHKPANIGVESVCAYNQIVTTFPAIDKDHVHTTRSIIDGSDG